MQCYYAVLKVAPQSTESEIKKAYYKLSRQKHPDKHLMNNLTIEEATTNFQVIQQAYETLSDPHERSYYDGHREQILFGEGDSDDDDPIVGQLSLYKYMNETCFTSFTDSEGGFFQVYNRLFEQIDAVESGDLARAADVAARKRASVAVELEDGHSGEGAPAAGKKKKKKKPAASPSSASAGGISFGFSHTSYALVARFYMRYTTFKTSRSCGFAGEYRLADADCRDIRRRMQHENQKSERKVQKEYSELVQRIASFCRRHDPRVRAHNDRLEREARARDDSRREEADKRAADKAEARERARAAERERWAEEAAERAAASDVGGSDDEDEDAGFACLLCNKSYGREGQLDAHIRSKKHVKVVKQKKMMGVPEEQYIVRPVVECESESDDEDSGGADSDAMLEEVLCDAGVAPGAATEGAAATLTNPSDAVSSAEVTPGAEVAEAAEVASSPCRVGEAAATGEACEAMDANAAAHESPEHKCKKLTKRERAAMAADAVGKINEDDADDDWDNKAARGRGKKGKKKR